MPDARSVIFVGIDRGAVRRLGITRTNMATLLGLSDSEFEERFAWRNLYGESSAPKDAGRAEHRRQADMLKPELCQYERAVLLGDRVAQAFGVKRWPLYEWAPLYEDSPLSVARMPHTSRRVWNTKGEGGPGRGL